MVRYWRQELSIFDDLLCVARAVLSALQPSVMHRNTTHTHTSTQLLRADVRKHHTRALKICSQLLILQHASRRFDEGTLISEFLTKNCFWIFLVAVLVHAFVKTQPKTYIARLSDHAFLKLLFKPFLLDDAFHDAHALTVRAQQPSLLGITCATAIPTITR